MNGREIERERKKVKGSFFVLWCCVRLFSPSPLLVSFLLMIFIFFSLSLPLFIIRHPLLYYLFHSFLLSQMHEKKMETVLVVLNCIIFECAQIFLEEWTELKVFFLKKALFVSFFCQKIKQHSPFFKIFFPFFFK